MNSPSALLTYLLPHKKFTWADLGGGINTNIHPVATPPLLVKILHAYYTPITALPLAHCMRDQNVPSRSSQQSTGSGRHHFGGGRRCFVLSKPASAPPRPVVCVDASKTNSRICRRRRQIAIVVDDATYDLRPT